METVLITGGTGMIGSRLCQLLLDKGYGVIILSRGPHQGKGNIRYAVWDVQSQTIDKVAIAAADHIIHLAGAGVGEKRWTRKRKQEIIDSRVESSRLIVKALHDTPNKVRTVVSASAIGWYGPDTKESLKKGFHEDALADRGFLGETCRRWEGGIELVEAFGKRLVKLRTGIVLSKSGGALHEFKKPVKLGLAPILGSGKQVMSWIQIEDLCRLYIEAMENTNFQGSYNAVSPQPVTNKTFVLALAGLLRGKFFVPIHVPSFALQLMMGEMSIEVLKSTTASADKIKATGFTFAYPEIDEALAASI